jgi:hypothetical protein
MSGIERIERKSKDIERAGTARLQWAIEAK